MPMLAELAARHCQPLRGEAHRLPAAKAQTLLDALPGWRLVEDGQALSKTFSFDDYHRTMAFVNALAFIAHAQDHHPDLAVHFNRCTVRFNTHDVGGISVTDFDCAARVDALAP